MLLGDRGQRPDWALRCQRGELVPKGRAHRGDVVGKGVFGKRGWGQMVKGLEHYASEVN